MSMAPPPCNGPWCTRTAIELCRHGNPFCEVCDCDCDDEFSLSVDVAADGTTTVDYTPPTTEHTVTTCPEGTCDGCPEPDTCETLRRDIWPHRPPTPAVRDALHLVGLDLPREA